MKFQDLGLSKQLTWALEKMGIHTPTPIQERTFSPILSGTDILGIAQTGTGKTLAYLLPVLREYKYSKSNQPKVLILVPTRELVVQIAEILEQLTEFMQVRVQGVYGGVNINTQKIRVYEGVDILVGTPGRVLDLATDNVINFRETKKLIVDEFDEMLSLGFRPQLTQLFTLMPSKRQNILFSATMTDEVDEILKEYFKSPKEISLARSGTPLEKIKQTAVPVQNFNTKINYLLYLLEYDKKASRILIFANNKKHADLIYSKVEESFPQQFGVIHSNKSQNYRLREMQTFRDGGYRGIITTDIMARGLDIPEVTDVINFEIPEVPEQYIHRIGRTGRADKSGRALALFTKKEEENFLEIQALMDMEVPLLPFPEEIAISEVKIESEKEVVKMKALTQPKLSGGGAFHQKKEKNKKVNLGGPTRRNPPKTKPANRGQQKQKARKRK